MAINEIKKWLPVVIGVGGIILIGVGILISQNKKVEEPEFVVEKDSGRGQSDDGVKIIIVDVAGAVEKPGVYKLPNNSRTADALISAGGLSAAADREAVSKTINLAQKLTDGSKIYIPSINESNSFNQSNKSNLININFASLLELDSLEGVGPVTAQKIIDNRPYQNISDLVTKKVLGKAMFEKIKDKLSVY